MTFLRRAPFTQLTALSSGPLGVTLGAMTSSAARVEVLSAVAGVRRRRAARQLGLAGALVALALLAASSAPSAVAFALLMAVAVAAAALGRSLRLRPGTLAVDARVTWQPRGAAPWSCPREALVAGWHEPAADGERVVFQFSHGDELVAMVDGPETARACLDRAGVGVGQRAMLFATRSSMARMAWFFGAFTLFSFMVFPWAGVVMLLPLATTALLTVVMLRPVDTMEVLVGSDGLTVRGELDDRFVAFASVDEVRDEDRGVALSLRDGGEFVVAGPALGAWQRRAVSERIRDALDALRAADASARTRSLLARGDTPFDAWRSSLRAQARGEAIYRNNALDRAELFDVLDDTSAPPAQRAAAAMVLAALDDRRDEALTRVRVAAESSASDPLRRALERVLDDGLDERAWMRLERAAERR
jgi:hypothetical protein